MRHGKRPGYHVVAAIAACAVGAGLFLSAGTYGMAAERSLASRAVTATGKNETVTVRTQADGTIEDVHVAAKLTNGDGGEVLLYRSSLSDISCTGEALAFERGISGLDRLLYFYFCGLCAFDIFDVIDLICHL